MRIVSLETIPLHIPVKVPLVESGGSFTEFNHVVIMIHTDKGVTGLGEVEVYPSFERPGVETQQGVLAILRDYLGPCLVGENPFNFEFIWLKME